MTSIRTTTVLCTFALALIVGPHAGVAGPIQTCSGCDSTSQLWSSNVTDNTTTVCGESIAPTVSISIAEWPLGSCRDVTPCGPTLTKCKWSAYASIQLAQDDQEPGRTMTAEITTTCPGNAYGFGSGDEIAKASIAVTGDCGLECEIEATVKLFCNLTEAYAESETHALECTDCQ